MSYLYSKGSRFRCNPKTGIIEELNDEDGYRYVPLPPVPRNWKDTRLTKRDAKIEKKNSDIFVSYAIWESS